ncbi:MAG: prephenate dehydratase [Clostridia bacterium]|nr:prephenate dehydratase [Clostridia bacterium]
MNPELEIIGYLGPEGTYSEHAALKFAEKYKITKFKDFPTIPHVLQAVEHGEITLGIVPVENSIEGTVNITLDMLAHELSLRILGEIVIDIKHCLISKAKDLSKIHTIYSHPQALAQCRLFLQNHLTQACYLNCNSTAEAALLVKEGQEGLAAICSVWAAEKYQVDIICENISDYSSNQTRFLVVGKNDFCSNKNRQKTSLCVALAKNRPGGLYDILAEFIPDQIDLSKIESRPAKKELGEYIFFIDCLADLESEYKHVLNRLKQKCKLVKILGTYNRIEVYNQQDGER